MVNEAKATLSKIAEALQWHLRWVLKVAMMCMSFEAEGLGVIDQMLQLEKSESSRMVAQCLGECALREREGKICDPIVNERLDRVDLTNLSQNAVYPGNTAPCLSGTSPQHIRDSPDIVLGDLPFPIVFIG
jgi:hypothetical protein